MPDAARQVHDFIRHSLEAHIVLLGRDKKPIAADNLQFDPSCERICLELHHALDAVERAFSRDERLSQSPDRLARDIRGQLDKRRIKYTIDRRSNLLYLYGSEGTRGDWKYRATLPLDKWASYVSGGLAVLCTSNELSEWPALPDTCVADEEPLPLAVRVSPIDGLEYTWIPAGEFRMGAVPDDMNARHEEVPRHEVRIRRGFWLSRGPVTAGAYLRFAREQGVPMPEPPRFNRNWAETDHPVVRVTWHDASAYCRWAGGRLPTEAEWEYVARGGKDGFCFPWGNDASPDGANYSDSKIGGTSAAGNYAPNGFGLYDMAGNVSEWCSDWFSGEYYREVSRRGIAEDPAGPAVGTVRVLRGGSWCYSARYMRSSYRLWFEPEDHDYDIGFRCVREEMP